MSDWPSTGIPLTVLARDARTLDVVTFEARYARAFFLRHGSSSGPLRGPTRTAPGPFEGVGGGAPQAESTGEIVIVALPVRRSPASEQPFVGIGRLDNNDISIHDETVSKFHAYVKEGPDGTFVIQDAKSRNGTTVEGVPVAQRGAGPPTRLAFGQTVRFGSVSTTFIDSSAVVALATRVTRA